MKKLFLVDAYALIYRCYYAFITRPMRNNAGFNTSAVFGFTKILNELIVREKPHYIGVAFDPKGGNFRNELFAAYKANRSATPEDIVASVPYIKRILEAMRIPILEIPGYEADDVIGTLSVKAAHGGFEVFMVTPDKDFGQLVQPNVHIYKQRNKGEGIEIIYEKDVKEHYGVNDPKLVIDVLALWGDTSDNIPGVPGIGEKSAIKLIAEWGGVENIIANASKIKGKTGENIAAAAEQIALSKRLATIELNVPVEFEPEKLVMEDPDCDALREVYAELNFSSFLKALDQNIPVACGPGNYTPRAGAPKAAKPAVQDLFSSAPHVQADMFDSAASGGYDDISTVKHKYHTLTQKKDIEELAARLEKSVNFCFDTETTGFDVFNDRLVGLAFAIEEGEAYYVPCPAEREATLEILKCFKRAWEDEKISKTAQNAKFDIMFLRSYGIEVNGFLYDTMIIHYLIDPETRHNMAYLTRRYLNYSTVPIESLIGRGARQITMDMVSVERVAEYAAEDADVTLRLKNVLWPELEKQELAELYRKIEEPLIKVLASMEREGIRIDPLSLKAYGDEIKHELRALEKQIREMVGDPAININSPRQLGDALFGRMKIDPAAKMTKTKQYRTDEEYLQGIIDRHPVIAAILEYRGLNKLLSTYIEALPQLINRSTGKIHTSFNQAVAATGRLSSNNPNLQNIPIRDEKGRLLRKAFIPSEEGCLLLSADYSQVELRLMAHLSGDENMIEAFRSGKDIHSATAARLFGVAESAVTAEQRRRAKTANFGIIYGISAFGLSQRLTIPRTEAKAIIDGYFESYPGVKIYIDQCIRDAQEKGYVTTLFGRKRYLPDINSSNAVVRGLAQRNAINAPIQGGAADIIKLAMIEVDKHLRQHKLRSTLMLQVHDELILNLYPEETEQVKKIVIDSMEHAAKLKVPLTADCGVGKNWLEAH